VKTRLSKNHVGALWEQAEHRVRNPRNLADETVWILAAEVIARRGNDWAESVLDQDLPAGSVSYRPHAELLLLADEAEIGWVDQGSEAHSSDSDQWPGEPSQRQSEIDVLSQALPTPQSNRADQVFTREPTGLRRLDSLDRVAALPDGTVVIWSDDDARQAGVLETEDGRGRVVRPISIGRYEDDWQLGVVVPPVWVVAFDDPPEVH